MDLAQRLFKIAEETNTHEANTRICKLVDEKLNIGQASEELTWWSKDFNKQLGENRNPEYVKKTLEDFFRERKLIDSASLENLPIAALLGFPITTSGYDVNFLQYYSLGLVDIGMVLMSMAGGIDAECLVTQRKVQITPNVDIYHLIIKNNGGDDLVVDPHKFKLLDVAEERGDLVLSKRLNPDQIPALVYYERGKLFEKLNAPQYDWRKGDYDSAISDYEKALEICPCLETASVGLAFNHLSIANYLSCYHLWNRQKENKTPSVEELQKIVTHSKIAEELLTQVIKKCPEYALAHHYLGNAYLGIGTALELMKINGSEEYDELAMDAFDRAALLDYDFETKNRTLIGLTFHLRKKDHLLTILELSEAIGSDSWGINSDAHFIRADVLNDYGRKDFVDIDREIGGIKSEESMYVTCLNKRLHIAGVTNEMGGWRYFKPKDVLSGKSNPTFNFYRD